MSKTENENAVVAVQGIVPDASQLAIVTKIEKGLTAMEKTYKKVPDCSTPEGYEKCKKERKAIGDVRIAAKKAATAYTAPLFQEKKRIDTSLREDINPRIAVLEDARVAAMKVVDDKIAAELERKAEIEAARVAGLDARVESIKAMPSESITLEDCDTSLVALRVIIDEGFDGFAEFKDAAELWVSRSVASITERRAALAEHAEEAERLAEVKREQEAEAERQREAAEQIERDKQAEEKRQKDAADQLQRERDEFEAEKKAEAERVAQAERDAEAKRQADIAEAARVVAAEIRAEQEALGASMAADIDAAMEAENKRVAAERAAALAPDADKLRAWIDSVPEVPTMATPEGKEAAEAVVNYLQELGFVINDLQNSLEG